MNYSSEEFPISLSHWKVQSILSFILTKEIKNFADISVEISILQRLGKYTINQTTLIGKTLDTKKKNLLVLLIAKIDMIYKFVIPLRRIKLVRC